MLDSTLSQVSSSWPVPSVRRECLGLLQSQRTSACSVLGSSPVLCNCMFLCSYGYYLYGLPSHLISSLEVLLILVNMSVRTMRSNEGGAYIRLAALTEGR